MEFPTYKGNGQGPTNLNQLATYHLDTLDIARGTRVEGLNGQIGTVDEIVFDTTTGRITHLLVRKGNGLKRDALVPVEWIHQLARDHIDLAVRVEQVDEYAERPFDDEPGGESPEG